MRTIRRDLELKKICCFLAFALIYSAFIFANPSDFSVAEDAIRVISVEDNFKLLHPKAKNLHMQIQYAPVSGEVYFIYTCPAENFDSGEAIDTSLAVLEDFQKRNQYTGFRYKSKDKTKYVTGEDGVRRAVYSSRTVFLR
jgi:hypothetical protein